VAKYCFIVRSRDESRWIGHCIQSIIDNFSDLEIVVVDNDSTDDTLDVVKLFVNDRNNLNIKVKNLPKREYAPGRAINLGINSLETADEKSIICIISSHCVIKSFDKEHLESLLGEKDCCAVFAKQIPVYRGKKILFRYVWENFIYDDVVKNPIENIPQKRLFFHNALSFINYNDCKQNLFDETCTSKEDRVWIAKLSEKGKYCYFTPEVSCFHHWTPSGATWRGQG
jgi:glycosyltransferase involved in cell wall biosynthesis